MIGSYSPRVGRVYTIDSRILLLTYLLCSFSLFQGNWISLGLQALLILLVYRVWKMKIRSFLRGLGGLGWLIGLIILMKTTQILLPGQSRDLESVITILSDAFLIGSRLFLSLALVHWIASILNRSAIRDAIAWFISPFSPSLAKDFSLATMVMISAIPHLLSTGIMTRQAFLIRGIRLSRRPILVVLISSRHLLSQASWWIRHYADALVLRGGGRMELGNEGFWTNEVEPQVRLFHLLVSLPLAALFLGAGFLSTTLVNVLTPYFPL